MDSSEIQKALAAPFAVTHKKNNLDYITGEQAASRLNECLGWDGWAYRIVEHGVNEDEFWVLGELVIYNEAGHLVKQQFGSQKLNRGTEYGDGLKGAATDALKKCASLIGVGLYLHEKEGGESAPRQAAPVKAAPAKPTFIQYAESLGHSPDEVLDAAKSLYDSNDPNRLTAEQKQRVLVAVEDRKKAKKEAAA